MEKFTEEQKKFLDKCLDLHEQMEDGYIPTEFEVIKSMIRLTECNEDDVLRNGEGLKNAAISYVYGREYERKMFWANLTVVIGNNVPYRKDSYYIDKKHNEIIVDMLMAERFVKNNKGGWGNQYVKPYKKRTPYESARLIIEKQFDNFLRNIADEYILRMKALEEAKKLEALKKKYRNLDYNNIAEGPFRPNVVPICQKEEPIGWVPKHIKADEDYIVVKDMDKNEVIGCGNIKRIDDIKKGRGTIFVIKDVEFYYPGSYSSLLNTLINFPTRVKIVGEYTEITKDFWIRMNANLNEYDNTFELDRYRFQNTKYYRNNK